MSNATDKSKDAAAQENYNPARAVENDGNVAPDVDNKDGEFRPIEDYSSDFDKAKDASDKVIEDAREELPFTKEGAQKAADKLEESQAIAKVVGYTTHPDTPVKLTTDPVTPKLNDAEAKAAAYNVPVGSV